MTVAAHPTTRKKRTEVNHKVADVPDAAALLAWYDKHRRSLPWRAQPAERPDPYRVWLSEIMLQQTRVETVVRYYARFLTRFPTLQTLARAPLDQVLRAWAGLGYYTRARNLHACARVVVREHDGRFPSEEAELRKLPGIGDYTAAAIAAIAFGRKATPVDGNVERLMARLLAEEAPLPAAKGSLRAFAARLTPRSRAGDFAQAMMDLGATICTPRRPSCLVCPWREGCVAYRTGAPEAYPRRAPKRDGELRRGAAFFVRRADGRVLLRRRPLSGLLGGMMEVPTSEWTGAFDERGAIAAAPPFAWRRLRGRVRHVFTHFPLELVVYAADVPGGTRAPKGTRFVPLTELDGEALPSLMRKVVAHALGSQG